MDAMVMAVDVVAAVLLQGAASGGISVEASGRVATGGWHNPRLLPGMYPEPPADGIWDMTLIASAPTGPAIDVIRPVSASLVIARPPWCKGVRVHGTMGAIEAQLVSDGVLSVDFSALARPMSWVPFPWKDRQEVQRVDAEQAGGGDAWPWCARPQTK